MGRPIKISITCKVASSLTITTVCIWVNVVRFHAPTGLPVSNIIPIKCSAVFVVYR